MSISKQPPKRFPIRKGVACQLKWTQSTVYLTDGVSASCHKAGFGKYLTENGEINFQSSQSVGVSGNNTYYKLKNHNTLNHVASSKKFDPEKLLD